MTEAGKWRFTEFLSFKLDAPGDADMRKRASLPWTYGEVAQPQTWVHNRSHSKHSLGLWKSHDHNFHSRKYKTSSTQRDAQLPGPGQGKGRLLRWRRQTMRETRRMKAPPLRTDRCWEESPKDELPVERRALISPFIVHIPFTLFITWTLSGVIKISMLFRGICIGSLIMSG